MNPNMALAQAATPEQWGQWVAATGYPAPGQLPLAAASLMPGMAQAQGAPIDASWEQGMRRQRAATDPGWPSDGRRDTRKAQADQRGGKNAGPNASRKSDAARNASAKSASADAKRGAQRGRPADTAQQDPMLPVSPLITASTPRGFAQERGRSNSREPIGSPFSPGAIYPPTPSPGFPAALPMPLPKLFDFERLEAEQSEGSERATPASSRANPKAKAKAPSWSTMTPSPHYAGLHPGLSYAFGRPGSGEVIRVKEAKSEEAADGEDGAFDSANEFDSLMGWANDTSEEPASTQAAVSSYPKKPLTPVELPSSSSSPTRAENKMPASPVRGSPSPSRQSPLQTIVEEKPLEPPECLKIPEGKPDEEA